MVEVHRSILHSTYKILKLNKTIGRGSPLNTTEYIQNTKAKLVLDKKRFL